MKQRQYVKADVKEGAAIVTLNNPPLNLLSLQVLEELGDAVEEAASEPEVRGILITGAGDRAFSAGADVKLFKDKEQFTKYMELGQRVFGALEELEKPVVAAINGYALGGGNELAMACDLRVASEKASFGQPEVNLGMMPGWGGTQRLPRLIGKARAKELIYTAQIVDAGEALRIGLVNKVVPHGEEVSASLQTLKLIMTKAPKAIAASKKAIERGLQRAGMNEALEEEMKGVREVAATEDLREGVDAFLSKRQPVFKGR